MQYLCTQCNGSGSRQYMIDNVATDFFCYFCSGAGTITQYQKISCIAQEMAHSYVMSNMNNEEWKAIAQKCNVKYLEYLNAQRLNYHNKYLSELSALDDATIETFIYSYEDKKPVVKISKEQPSNNEPTGWFIGLDKHW